MVGCSFYNCTYDYKQNVIAKRNIMKNLKRQSKKKSNGMNEYITNDVEPEHIVLPILRHRDNTINYVKRLYGGSRNNDIVPCTFGHSPIQIILRYFLIDLQIIIQIKCIMDMMFMTNRIIYR